MADGFFLGGMNRGFNQSRANRRADKQLSLSERALALQEQQYQSNQEAQGRDLALQRLGETVKFVRETLESTKERLVLDAKRDDGTVDEQEMATIRQKLTGIVDQFGPDAIQFARVAGASEQQIVAGFQALIEAPTQAELDAQAAIDKGANAAAGTAAEKRGLIAAGFSEEQADKIVGADVSKGAVAVRTFLNPSTNQVEHLVGDEITETAIRALTDDGFIQTETPQIPNAQELGTAAMNDIETQLNSISDRRARVSAIKRRLKGNEDLLTFESQLRAKGLAFTEKLNPDLLNERDREFLKDFTGLKQAAYDDLNQTLKELSGAAINPQEAERLLKVLADFEKDSPTEFIAKIEGIEEKLRYAQARLNYIKQTQGTTLTDEQLKGLFSGISLDAMPQLMTRKAGEIEQQVRLENPNLDDAGVLQATKERLASYFGLGL